MTATKLRRTTEEGDDVVEDIRNNNSDCWCRWQEKLIGFLILVIHLGFTIDIHNHLLSHLSSSSQHFAVNGGSSPLPSQPPPLSYSVLSIMIDITLMCSFINVVSHSLVVLNRLKKVYVISILIGVTFDVASSLLYVWVYYYHYYYCYCNLDLSDVLLIEDERLHVLHVLLNMVIIIVWGLHFVWNFTNHVRALFLFTNLDRLESVVRSADNNLRGIPGPLCVDHIFAYTDLSNHLAVFFWSLSLSTPMRLMHGMIRPATPLESRNSYYVPSLLNNNNENNTPTSSGGDEGIATISSYSSNMIIMAATVFMLLLGRWWLMRRLVCGRYTNTNCLRASRDYNENGGWDEKNTSSRRTTTTTSINNRHQENIKTNTTTATGKNIINDNNSSSTATLNTVSLHDISNGNIGNNNEGSYDHDHVHDCDCDCPRDVLLLCSCPVCNNETAFRISVRSNRTTTMKAIEISSLPLLKLPSILVCRLWLTTFENILIQVKCIRNKQLRNYLKEKQ